MESVRLRSVAVDPEAKVPRRAAVLTGQRNAAVESVNGYVVFVSKDGALWMQVQEANAFGFILTLLRLQLCLLRSR